MALHNVIFNHEIYIAQATQIGKDQINQVWFQLPGLPGWVKELSTKTETVTFAATASTLTNLIKAIDPRPGFNDRDNHPEVENFQRCRNLHLDGLETKLAYHLDQAVNSKSCVTVFNFGGLNLTIVTHYAGLVNFTTDRYRLEVFGNESEQLEQEVLLYADALITTLVEQKVPVHQVLRHFETSTEWPDDFQKLETDTHFYRITC